MTRKKSFILGLDPGTTCGIAAIDLNGYFHFLDSRRGFPRSEIISLAISLGEPVVVASDVSPPPDLVNKISSTLNAVLYVPNQPISLQDKIDTVRSFAEEEGIEVKNDHERDALAAALKAYHHYQNKLRQIEARVRSMDAPPPLDEVKTLVIRGHSIKDSIEASLPVTQRLEPEHAPDEKQLSPKSPERERLDELESIKRSQEDRISRLREKNRRLTETLSERDREVESLSREIENLKREESSKLRRARRYRTLRREIVNLRSTLHSLREELEDYRNRLRSLREVRNLEVGGEAVVLKPIESFTTPGVEEASQTYRIKRGDAVLLQDASGGGVSTARLLAELEVSVIVAGSEMAHQVRSFFTSRGIPIIPAEELSIDWVEGYPYVNPKNLGEQIEQAEMGRRRLMSEELESTITQYRQARSEGD